MTMLSGGKGGDTVSGGYQIAKSLRLRKATSTKFSRTFGFAGSLTTWTISVFAKITPGTEIYFLNGTTGSANAQNDNIFIDTAGRVNCHYHGGAADIWWRQFTPIFRDPSAHYHIVLRSDLGNTTVANRLRLEVNGVAITSYTDSPTAPNGSWDFINDANAHNIGYAGNGTYSDCYLSEINFIDGQALAASSFGEFNSDGVWVPKKYSGTYGTNGFYLKFDDGTSATTLCYDRSGNSNNWTPSGISTTAGVTYDWMEDTPTNNYATYNPLLQSATYPTTFSNGNLRITRAGGAIGGAVSSIGVSSGKYYAEFTYTTAAATAILGRVGVTATNNFYSSTYFISGEFDAYGASTNGVGYFANGTRRLNDSDTSSWGATYTTGDVIQVCFDADTGKVWFGKNNTWQASGDPSAGTSPAATLTTGSNFWFTHQILDSAVWDANFGQRPFAYTPPTGFKALCTANRATGSIATSGSFTGNANADGPVVWLNGNPSTMTINGNAVTWRTHADKLAGGFKVRTSSTSYNASGTNTYSVTVTGKLFGDSSRAPNTAQGNP